MCGCNKQRTLKMQTNYTNVSSSSQLTQRTISPKTNPIPNSILDVKNLTNMNEETLRKERLRRDAIRRSLGR